MKVKVGDRWYSPAPGAPIMVQLTRRDRELIGAMHPNADRYAVFEDDEPRSAGERMAWMEDGYVPGPDGPGKTGS